MKWLLTLTNAAAMSCRWKDDYTRKASSTQITSFRRQRIDLDQEDDSFSQQPAFHAYVRGESPVVCIPNAFTRTRIAAWKQDVLALQALKFGGTAGVANNAGNKHTNTSIRTGVHQIWIQSPSTSSSMSGTNVLVGNLDARRDLQNAVNDLRQNLVIPVGTTTALHQQPQQPKWNLPADLVELSYLLYDGRSHARYGKHVDTFQKSTTTERAKDYERCVSFLIYLGDGNDGNQESSSWYSYLEEEECEGSTTTVSSKSRPWDCQRDGGALRIHGKASNFVLSDTPTAAIADRNEASSTDWCDIVPEAGTLVIFDSATVEHEVMPTFRDRVCIVGWLNKPL